MRKKGGAGAKISASQSQKILKLKQKTPFQKTILVLYSVQTVYIQYLEESQRKSCKSGKTCVGIFSYITGIY